MSFVDTLAAVLLAGVGLILLWLMVAAIRNPVLIKLGLRNIPRRPAQSALIVVGLTLSTIIFMSSLSLGDTLNYSVQRNAIDAYGAVDEIIAPPILSLLAGVGGGDATIDDPTTEAEENLNSLLEGGLTSLLTILEGGLFGISEERFQQLRSEAAEEPLIDAVAGSIIFPTIIRDVNSGQGEPLGFIFAVDSEYDENFGLTTIDGEPVQIESLASGVGNIFVQVSNLIDLVESAGADLGLEGFSLSDAVIAVAGSAAALTALSDEGIDLADLDIDLETLQFLGVDTAPLEEAGIDSLSLETLGLDEPQLDALGVTTTTVSLESLGIDVSGVQSTASDLLAGFNLNTLGGDIDSALGQVGLQLRQGDVYLNRLGADQLDARVGDVVEVYIGPIPIRFRVRAIVEAAGPMGALLPVVMMPLDEAQKLLFMDGKINNVLVSNLGDEQEGLVHTEAVSERLRVLALDPDAVERVTAILRRPAVMRAVQARAFQPFDEFGDGFHRPPPIVADFIRDAAGFDELGQQIETLPAELETPGISDGLRVLLASNGVRQWLTGLDLSPQDALDLDQALRQLNEFDLLDPLSKSTIVTAANVGGTVFTSMFTLFGMLSILAAILLIFLIFVMLAAERRSEIGMARAIGVQRSHVVQMFVAEGVVYDLAAAALGILLGLAVSYAMIGYIGGLFNDVVGLLGGQSSVFTFHFRGVPSSIVIAYTAGVILTFFVVALASWRVSRMNIVAAMRDLPESTSRGNGSTAGRLLRFLLGPFLLLAGILLIVIPAEVEGNRVRLAVTLLLAGSSFLAGSLLGRTRLRKESIRRVVYTIIGLGLVLIWGVPWLDWLGVSSSLFDQDLGLAGLTFALTAPLVILGAIMVVMFNADAWTGAINGLLGGIGALSPVLKTAIAYPLSSRFRTGMTMLLFAMVISTVTIMSVVIEATETLVESDGARSAGFEIEAGFSLLSFFDPMEDLESEIKTSTEFSGETIDAVGSVTDLFIEARQAEESTELADFWGNTQFSGLNEGYLNQAEQYYIFRARAAGFESDADVWQALRERDDVVVVTSDLVSDRFSSFERVGPHGRGPGFEGGFGGFFRLDAIDPDGDTLPEIHLALRQREGQGTMQSVQVIGVLEDEKTLASGWIQGNVRVLEAVTGEAVAPDRYYLKVSDGADARRVAADLERAFLGNALEASLLTDSDFAIQAATRGMLQLFQGFLALGLLVGIAALGVISTRSVVERRQQVGMLRAIGYQSNMVALSFLLESSFIALTGILIGVAAGVILGGDIVSVFYGTIAPDQSFAIPWSQIGFIVLLAYLFSLLTTLLPAYQASRIYPAEALRYE
ncbi:MAG: FtsX-like permease family protein [Chloroflexota bacterium]|nr:FtsX-like permease family protein [Chloroflexota bacterium]